MTVTEPVATQDIIESPRAADPRRMAWVGPRLLYGIAAFVTLTAIVGNALIWTSWTTLYRTTGSPTAWLWGQFIAGIAVPLGIAGLIATAGFLLSRWEREHT